MQINIGVENKVAQLVDLKQYIVCGNSDYIINFLFDDEWNDHPAKTARFEWGSNSVEIPFTGTQCPCPVITDTIVVKIGVFAGDLDATTPAYVMCRKSILCGSGGHDDPSLDVYNQLMGLLDEMQTGGGSGKPGKDGITPHIGENGNWYIGDEDTGVQAQGEDGEPGQPGEPGSDYVLTESDKAEIAQEAARQIDMSGFAKQTDVDNLSKAIANLQISGLTTAQVNALDGMFKIASYTTEPTAAYSAFKLAFGIEDSGEEEPDTEKTLTSISATYSGGDVAVGTTLTDLTGIVVTATYSDGSTAAVTDYTLTGEIAEGSNTITVSYGGLTDTFAVTGVVESEGENNGWTDGVPYTVEWTDGYRIDYSSESETFGEPIAVEGKSVSGFLPCRGLAAITASGAYLNFGVYYYKADKTLLQRASANKDYPVSVPFDAYFVRVNANTANKESVVITPKQLDKLTETKAWESGVYYTAEREIGDISSDTGAEIDNTAKLRTGYLFCFGATSLKVGTYIQNYRTSAAFYDENKAYISGATITGSTWDVPANAKYFRHGCLAEDIYKNGGEMSNPWIVLE